MNRTLFISYVLLSCTVSLYAQWLPTTGADGNTVTGIVQKGGRLFSSTHGGGIFVSSDEGGTWTETNGGLVIKTMTALLATSDALFAGNFYGDILRSTDDGGSWTNLNPPIFSDIRSLYAAGTTLFAGADGLYRSTNNGASWIEIKALEGRYINAIIQKGTTLFVAGSGVLRSTDNGSTWTKVHNGLQDTGTFDFAVLGNRIFVLANWSLYSSTNNGTSWSQVKHPISDGYPISCLETSGSVLFCGTFNGVYYSTNSGSSWIVGNTDMEDSSISTLNAFGSHLFAGTYYGEETGIWRRPLADFGIAGVGEQMPSKELSIQCYPNPVRTTANLIVENANDASVEVHVYDLHGKERATLTGNSTNAGTVSLQWDASIIPSGIYECVVRTSSDYARLVLIVQH